MDPATNLVVLRYGIDGTPNVRRHPTGGAIAADHVPEHALLELFDLVEPQQRDFGRLPIQYRGGILQGGKLDPRLRRELPRIVTLVGHAVCIWIQLHTLI